MKCLLCGTLLLLALNSGAQEKAQNLFIITSDGLRWQEVFNGADSLLIGDASLVQDTALARLLYWDESPVERRKKLMPFFWNVIAKQGQLYGNRQMASRMNLKNVYKISYPGYNELLTGYADRLPVLNAPQANRNKTLLSFLSEQPAFADSVAAFTSWNVFPFILSKNKKAQMQNCGYQCITDSSEGTAVVNEVQNGVVQKLKTRYDLLTFFTAKQYVSRHHPRVVFLGLGETDEAAHRGRYDEYLQHINAVDKMIADLWIAVQADTFYRGNTVFLMATDHGRGRGAKWTTHHTFIRGSGEVWLALLGKNIAPLGERQNVETIYQNQVAATAAFLLGQEFTTSRRTGAPITLSTNEKQIPSQPNGMATTAAVAASK